MNAAQILVSARAKIEDPAHWGKGPRINRPETYCAAEAIEDSTPLEEPSTTPAYLPLYQAAGLSFKTDSLPDWNDAPERTHAEVLAAFDRAIESANA